MEQAGSAVIDRKSRHHNWIEIASAILLALATVASAWSAYQSTRWHGRETEGFADSTTARIYSAEAKDKANQQIEVDVATFSDYAFAYSEGDMKLVNFYESSLFRPEMKAAVDAWKATNPLQNPDAPESPFEMSEYRNSNREKAQRLEREAQNKTHEANAAIRHADNYVLLTVIFASVLFFAGISTKFTTLKIKYALLITGGVVFVCSVVVLLLQPFA